MIVMNQPQMELKSEVYQLHNNPYSMNSDYDDEKLYKYFTLKHLGVGIYRIIM